MGCIPVRRIQENECTDIVSKNDLESNKDIYRVAAKKAVPYRCGTVTEYYYQSWEGIIVTVRRAHRCRLKTWFAEQHFSEFTDGRTGKPTGVERTRSSAFTWGHTDPRTPSNIFGL
ncbi:hypothetical protein QYM36_005117 [Artemia franciscana]|uniref:Uncharacterized protein n=1 Tax=Artemia franciscana TaxID=6661 RepID=A0AA88ICY8_ARTSF|nr:hypothetical protein QYM36_005117 [Artemia franciscana]